MKFPILFNVFGEFQCFLPSLYFFLEWHNDTPLYTSVLISLLPDIILISFRICLAEFSSLTIALAFLRKKMVIFMLQPYLLFKIPYIMHKKRILSFSVTGGRSYSKINSGFLPWSGPFWHLDPGWQSKSVCGQRQSLIASPSELGIPSSLPTEAIHTWMV